MHGGELTISSISSNKKPLFLLRNNHSPPSLSHTALHPQGNHRFEFLAEDSLIMIPSANPQFPRSVAELENRGARPSRPEWLNEATLTKVVWPG